ncbi:putative alcohol dehydrogenase [Phytophthora cinnamomi]|uniref:putative alcohol dehydrogenase n=1 Tax=Phytophthora cinnamomi TaxID=4785 RepID=UPI003559DAC4|nr:putative alcohol dehydrogenase [Phytophthora cinnamomi]
MSTIPTTFKVYQYERFGQDPLKEIKFNRKAEQKPLRPGEVRVKIFSAALNPIDYKMITYGPALVSTGPTPEHPFRLGFDLAGKVVELGSEVKDYAIGDEVYAMPWLDAIGSFGEYINVDTKFLAHKPTNMSWNEAAGVPLAGQTSWQAIHTYGKLQKDQRVLIIGGSSGTGTFAIQIAKAVGAQVITTCSRRNVELVKSLGADRVIDYTEEKWSEVLDEHSIDLIYDCDFEASSWNVEAQKVLKEQTGIFVTIGVIDKPVDSLIGATLHQIFNAPCTAYLLELKKLAEAGKLKTVIDSVHPLEDVMDAMKICLSHRAKGKIVVEVATE